MASGVEPRELRRAVEVEHREVVGVAVAVGVDVRVVVVRTEEHAPGAARLAHRAERRRIAGRRIDFRQTVVVPPALPGVLHEDRVVQTVLRRLRQALRRLGVVAAPLVETHARTERGASGARLVARHGAEAASRLERALRRRHERECRVMVRMEREEVLLAVAAHRVLHHVHGLHHGQPVRVVRAHVARGESEPVRVERELLRPLHDVAEAHVDAVRRLGGGTDSEVDDARESGRVARCAGNRPGDAQRALLLADRRLRLGGRRTVVRRHLCGKAAEDDRLLAVSERERAVDEPARAVGDARTVHDAVRVKTPAARRRVRSRRARRLCRGESRRAPRGPVGLVRRLRLRPHQQLHVAPAAAVAAGVHLRARTRPEAELDLLPRPWREVARHVLPREDVLHDLRTDELRLASLLQHEHLILRAVRGRRVVVVNEVVGAGERERRDGRKVKREVAPDEPRALLIGRMGAETVLRHATRRGTALRHVAAPFLRGAVLRHGHHLPLDLDKGRAHEPGVKAERAGTELGRSRLPHGTRRVGVLVHEDRDRVRRVLLLRARGREARVDGIEGVERARTRRARVRQLLLLAGREREGTLRTRHVPVVVHPHLELARDGLVRLVLQRHGEGTRRAGLDLGDAERPGERVLVVPLDLLRERPDLHLHAAPFLDGRQVCGCRPRGHRHAKNNDRLQN